MGDAINILIPLPSYGFDPTEAAVPWKLLQANGFGVTFATPKGQIARGDEIMLTGKGLRVFSRLLKAREDAIAAYKEMEQSQAFRHPISYSAIDPDLFDAVYLPGGHDKGVREYLESPILQSLLPYFFSKKKKVGAICHGVLLLARSKEPQSGKSVLYTYQTTALLKSQELLAYHLTKRWLGDYYRTYPETTVEDEVKSALQSPQQFVSGPKPVFRDTKNNTRHGFSLRDKNYLSARWPGDIYNFTFSFMRLLTE